MKKNTQKTYQSPTAVYLEVNRQLVIASSGGRNDYDPEEW